MRQLLVQMGGKASQISPSNQGRGKAARLGVKRLERGKQWVSQRYPSGVVACGLEQPIACHQAGACDIGQGEATGGKQHLPLAFPSRLALVYPLLLSPLSLQEGLPGSRVRRCHPKPGVVSPGEAGTMGSC